MFAVVVFRLLTQGTGYWKVSADLERLKIKILTSPSPTMTKLKKQEIRSNSRKQRWLNLFRKIVGNTLSDT